MSLTGKEIAQMHKDYVMQSWSKSGVDALPVERAEGIYEDLSLPGCVL